MKICLACSHGGHLTEMTELLSAFDGHEVFFVTYVSPRKIKDHRAYYLQNLGKSPLRFMLSLPGILGILRREKPDLIVSTGSEIAIPVFYMGRLLRIKTIFIESICRVKSPSATGKIVYPVASLFFVQWEQLLGKYGKKARYRGNIL